MLWIEYQRLDHRGNWERIPTFGSIQRYPFVNAAFVEIDGLGNFIIYWDLDEGSEVAKGILSYSDHDVLIRFRELGIDTGRFEFYGESLRAPGTVVLSGITRPVLPL